MADEALLTGRHEPPTVVRQLRAGPVTCVLDGIELRDIRLGGVELANLVYVAIRDEHWNTVPALVSGLDVTTGPDWFRVSFRARHLAGDMDLSWDGRIRGDGDGTIIYALDATAATSFRYNRIGCNILLNQIPSSGKIFIVRNGQIQTKDSVLSQWKRTLFLREESSEGRGWLIEVMKCVESIGKKEFNLDDVYAFEAQLSGIYPNNRHVKQKIRQQLQVLRDRGYLDFVSRGYYRFRSND